MESVIEEEDDHNESQNDKPIKVRQEFKETDPEVQNAKLLQKYAEM